MAMDTIPAAIHSLIVKVIAQFASRISQGPLRMEYYNKIHSTFQTHFGSVLKSPAFMGEYQSTQVVNRIVNGLEVI